MNVIVVASGTKGYVSPFISELYQDNKHVNVEYFIIRKKGIIGYMKYYFLFLIYLFKNKKSIDLIHAHYGLSGLLPFLQFYKPYVVTFHGSDLFDKRNRIISKIISLRSKANIIVVGSMAKFLNKNIELMPCGVNTEIFYKKNDEEIDALKMKYKKDKRWVLFSSSFKRKVKNFELAKSSAALLGDDFELIELNGYNRNQVAELMNICDCALLTSDWEGSPQFIKECIACNLPTVSVDVGDVRKLFYQYKFGQIVSRDPEEIKEAIVELIAKSEGINLTPSGEEILKKLGLNLRDTQTRLNALYQSLNENIN